MRHQLRAIAVISAISCGLAVLQASSSMGRVPLGDQASVTEKRRSQEMSLGHTLEAVARARAAGRPDILASPWDRVVRDEHANIIEVGGPAT